MSNDNKKELRFEGVPFRLGGTTYIVPGLSTKQMKLRRDDIVRAMQIEQGKHETVEQQEAAMSDLLDIAVRITQSALSRNYEGISTEMLEDLVDMNNVRPLITAVMGQSGMKLVTSVPAVTEGAGES